MGETRQFSIQSAFNVFVSGRLIPLASRQWFDRLTIPSAVEGLPLAGRLRYTSAS